MAERQCDVRLAVARTPDEQHVLVAREERAGREVDVLGLQRHGLNWIYRAHEARGAEPHLDVFAAGWNLSLRSTS